VQEGHLFFKHQRKEEDYECQPGWAQQLTALHNKVGWGFFEEGIQRGQFLDFERGALNRLHSS
jgi:hypothetical protein